MSFGSWPVLLGSPPSTLWHYPPPLLIPGAPRPHGLTWPATFLLHLRSFHSLLWPLCQLGPQVSSHTENSLGPCRSHREEKRREEKRREDKICIMLVYEQERQEKDWPSSSAVCLYTYSVVYLVAVENFEWVPQMSLSKAKGSEGVQTGRGKHHTGQWRRPPIPQMGLS